MDTGCDDRWHHPAWLLLRAENAPFILGFLGRVFIEDNGFTIRRQFPHARSMLMDRTTLLDHEPQRVREDKPAIGTLPLLTQAEAALYQDLVDDTFGPAV